MPIIRNPFRKQDENARPSTPSNALDPKSNAANGVKPISIQDKAPTEYKLSEINDSGVYLPPSPPERKSFWTTSSSRSTTSSNHRSLLSDHTSNSGATEQFSISRESFDSYRRSFDISARSPVIQAYDSSSSISTAAAGRPRASLDSRTFAAYDSYGASSATPGRAPRASLDSRTFQPPPPRSSNSFTRPSQVPAATTEEDSGEHNFEEVDIVDRSSLPTTQQNPPPAKKRGLFSRITDSGDHAERPAGSGDGGRSWHHFGGRRRGQSGQGAELGSIPNRESATPKPESQLRREDRVASGSGPGSGTASPLQVGKQVPQQAASVLGGGQEKTEGPVAAPLLAQQQDATHSALPAQEAQPALTIPLLIEPQAEPGPQSPPTDATTAAAEAVAARVTMAPIISSDTSSPAVATTPAAPSAAASTPIPTKDAPSTASQQSSRAPESTPPADSAGNGVGR